MAGSLLSLSLLAALLAAASAGPIWMIHIGNEWGAHEYFDDMGYLKGFGIGMIDLVCTAGKMDCRIVWDKYENCFNHYGDGERPAGGMGLMGKWYDGCIGWVPTIERIHTMAFTTPYIKQRKSYFYILKGQENGFNPKDIRNKKIAILDGWATNEQCLARQDQIQGHIVTPDQVVRVPQASDAIQAMRDERAHAMFGSGDNWTTEQENMLHKYTDPEMTCTLGGWGLMARKDNGVVSAWNVGFAKLKEGNKFNQYCEDANREHSAKGRVDCITQ